MMRFIAWNIYKQPLNRIVIWTVPLVFLWAFLIRVFRNYAARYHGIWRIINGVFLTISSIAIAYFTLWNRNEHPDVIMLVPFHTFQEAKAQPELYRSMMMNVFLFVPFGLSLPNVIECPIRSSKKCKPFVVVVLATLFGLCLSALIEYFQYRYSLGRCEVDDVIMNTLGTLIGALSYLIGSLAWKSGKSDNKNAE